MDPAEVETPRQVLPGQVKTVTQVASPVRDAGALVAVQPGDDIPRRARSHHRVGHAFRAVSKHQILEQAAVAIAAIPPVPPERASLGIGDDRGHVLVLGVHVVEAVAQPLQQAAVYRLGESRSDGVLRRAGPSQENLDVQLADVAGAMGIHHLEQ